MREIAGRAALHFRVAVLPDDSGVAGERQDGDRVRELLVGDDVAMIGGEEGVVRAGELLPGGEGAWSGETPDDPFAWVDDDDPVVVAVGDHQVPGQRRGPAQG